MKTSNQTITRKVRANVFAYKYSNGWIVIDGTRYLYYTLAEAIKKWRSSNPLKAKS